MLTGQEVGSKLQSWVGREKSGRLLREPFPVSTDVIIYEKARAKMTKISRDALSLQSRQRFKWNGCLDLIGLS